MRNLTMIVITFLLILPLTGQSCYAEVMQLSEHVSLIPGPVNGVDIEKDNAHLVIYGDPSGKIKKADMMLFTHSRRDVVWAGRELVENGATAVVPYSAKAKFNNVEQFWNDFTTRRFHDYAQQGSKILTESLRIGRVVKDGENISWKGIPVEIVETPGYTRHAVSYIIEIDDLKYAFVGDIMYGEGISKTGELIDLAVDHELIKKSGSWFSYNDTKLGQGRDAVKQLLTDNPELADELEEKIIEKLNNPE